MLYKKMYCLVLVMFMASMAFGQVTNWTNATGDGQWMNPENWEPNVVPGPGTGNTRINPDTNVDPNNPVGPTIGPGDLAITDAADVWGPEFGAISVNIEGGNYTSPAWVGMVTVGSDPNASPSINLGKGGSGGWLDVINFLVGHSWWWTDGPYTTYNQWSGTAIVRDSLWLGGQMNLYGGIMYVFNGVVMATDVHSADITTLNIAGGTLMLPLIATPDDPATTDVDETVTFTQRVQEWIDAGYCVAYGGTGDIVIEETDSWTRVTADPNATD